MNKSLAATKANLMKTKKTLELSLTGYDLMDRKRNILIREMMSLIDRAKELQGAINIKFSDAYLALQNANISLGLSSVSSIAESVTIDNSVTVLLKSVMGVEVPNVRSESVQPTLSYELSGTNAALDEATASFNDAKNFMYELAEIENSLYRLAAAIKKTQKRANALNSIIIPGYKEIISRITSELEEKEREEFSRMKVIKKTKS